MNIELSVRRFKDLYPKSLVFYGTFWYPWFRLISGSEIRRIFIF